MGYRLNPSTRIIVDTSLALRIGSDKAAHVELIGSPTQLDGLYLLATLKPDDLEVFVGDRMSHDHEITHALRTAGLLVTSDENHPDPAPSEYAFSLKDWGSMRFKAASAPARYRDEVHIVDSILPETARFSIDIWVKTLPYRRVDIDRPDTRDFHWIFTMSPPLDHVRSVPFLRAIDEKVRAVVRVPALDLFRAYVYAGSPADIYRVHRDSTVATDVTAIYFPTPWEDHFGGELLFYDGGEPRWVIAPRANRLIVFQGSREHRVATVSHANGSSRCSIVLRYATATISI